MELIKKLLEKDKNFDVEIRSLIKDIFGSKDFKFPQGNYSTEKKEWLEEEMIEKYIQQKFKEYNENPKKLLREDIHFFVLSFLLDKEMFCVKRHSYALINKTFLENKVRSFEKCGYLINNIKRLYEFEFDILGDYEIKCDEFDYQKGKIPGDNFQKEFFKKKDKWTIFSNWFFKEKQKFLFFYYNGVFRIFKKSKKDYPIEIKSDDPIFFLIVFLSIFSSFKYREIDFYYFFCDFIINISTKKETISSTLSFLLKEYKKVERDKEIRYKYKKDEEEESKKDEEEKSKKDEEEESKKKEKEKFFLGKLGEEIEIQMKEKETNLFKKRFSEKNPDIIEKKVFFEKIEGKLVLDMKKILKKLLNFDFLKKQNFFEEFQKIFLGTKESCGFFYIKMKRKGFISVKKTDLLQFKKNTDERNRSRLAIETEKNKRKDSVFNIYLEEKLFHILMSIFFPDRSFVFFYNKENVTLDSISRKVEDLLQGKVSNEAEKSPVVFALFFYCFFFEKYKREGFYLDSRIINKIIEIIISGNFLSEYEETIKDYLITKEEYEEKEAFFLKKIREEIQEIEQKKREEKKKIEEEIEEKNKKKNMEIEKKKKEQDEEKVKIKEEIAMLKTFYENLLLVQKVVELKIEKENFYTIGKEGQKKEIVFWDFLKNQIKNFHCLDELDFFQKLRLTFCLKKNFNIVFKLKEIKVLKEFNQELSFKETNKEFHLLIFLFFPVFLFITNEKEFYTDTEKRLYPTQILEILFTGGKIRNDPKGLYKDINKFYDPTNFYIILNNVKSLYNSIRKERRDFKFSFCLQELKEIKCKCNCNMTVKVFTNNLLQFFNPVYHLKLPENIISLFSDVILSFYEKNICEKNISNQKLFIEKFPLFFMEKKNKKIYFSYRYDQEERIFFKEQNIRFFSIFYCLFCYLYLYFSEYRKQVNFDEYMNFISLESILNIFFSTKISSFDELVKKLYT